MIKKAIISTIAITLAYTLVIVFVQPTNIKGNTQKQVNVISVQKYIYEKNRETDYVIVGSSLGARISQENLPQKFWNLSLNGKSVFEGLEIVRQSSEKPRVVMIETNLIHRKGDHNFLKEIYKPIPFALKKYIPITREEYQPVNILVTLLKRFKKSKEIEAINSVKMKEEESIASNQPTKRYTEMLASSIQKYSNEPSTELIRKNMEYLEEIIKDLEADGVSITFFEMPFDPQLCDLKWFIYNRKKLKESFPDTNYAYIERPSCDNFITTDGMHLNKTSARRYTNFFVQEIKKTIALRR